MDSLQVNTKELLTHHCSCHGNLVTIATKYVADAYCPKERLFQIWCNRAKDKGVIGLSLWLP